MNANRTSPRKVDTVPADDLALREVDSGGSPRGGGSFRLSQAVAAEREETRKRLSRELLEGSSNNNKNKDEDEDEDEDDNEDEDEDDGGFPNMGPPSNQPMKMSLMDLLEETDRQAGISGPTYRLDDEDEEEYEEEEGKEVDEDEDLDEDDEKGELSCCVCKVKHKGSPFIPCGHTFCRLCSKELRVEKGNCPLCNDFVTEVLDVF